MKPFYLYLCITIKKTNIMKNLKKTIYKVGQYYIYKNESASKITEVRNGKYTFIKLENGNLISVCK